MVVEYVVLHRNANGVGVNGDGVKTIKAIKTIQTPKTCMRTRINAET